MVEFLKKESMVSYIYTIQCYGRLRLKDNWTTHYNVFWERVFWLRYYRLFSRNSISKFTMVFDITWKNIRWGTRWYSRRIIFFKKSILIYLTCIFSCSLREKYHLDSFSCSYRNWELSGRGMHKQQVPV